MEEVVLLGENKYDKGLEREEEYEKGHWREEELETGQYGVNGGEKRCRGKRRMKKVNKKKRIGEESR